MPQVVVNQLCLIVLPAAAILAGAVNVASATELEVTHWWTSGGEANAVEGGLTAGAVKG